MTANAIENMVYNLGLCKSASALLGCNGNPSSALKSDVRS